MDIFVYNDSKIINFLSAKQTSSFKSSMFDYKKKFVYQRDTPICI